MRNYNGILRKPTLFEHWHKGFAAALAVWLPAFLFNSLFISNLYGIALCATLFSFMVITATITHYEGFSINFENRRYRNYTWILGLRFGKWHSLPPIAAILLKSYQYQHFFPMTKGNNNPIKLGFTAKETGFQVLLSVANSSDGIVAAYAANDKATHIAAELGKILNVEIISA